MEGLKGRTWVAIAGMILAFVLVLPNVVNFGNSWWFSKQKLNFGLDIQGGLHLVMGVDVQGVVGESTQRLIASIKQELQEKAVVVGNVAMTDPKLGEVTFTFTGPEAKAGIVKLLESRPYDTQLQTIGSTDSEIKVRYYENYIRDFKTKVIHQSIETIRNRIDEFGVAEPSISQQGDERILIQLPGMADAERAKQLINTTAKLDFMIVAEESDTLDLRKMVEEAEKAGNYSMETLKYSAYVDRLNQDLKTKIPANTMILFQKAGNAATLEVAKEPLLVHTDTNLSGDSLSDANVAFGQYGEPEVSLKFNPIGAQKFKVITGANIGKRLAVALDKVIKTAPNLQTEIPNGEARITLGGSRDQEKQLEEAKMIATTLRAGALPAALEQLEERRVGPSLGADSIRKAQLGAFAGALLIIIFMIARYKGMGVITSTVLIFNVVCGLALLTMLGATLTLPGIAGIALTVGFAVDANVLINERMREELNKGMTFLGAAKEGYHRAMSAILDANATVAATAVVLYFFGTGPVRGFAVTLLIGIVTTLFANVFVSKVILDNLVYKYNIKKLSV